MIHENIQDMKEHDKEIKKQRYNKKNKLFHQ